MVIPAASGTGSTASKRRGACFVFEQRPLSEEWSEVAALGAPDGDVQFGHAVAMHGDAGLVASKKPADGGAAVHGLVLGGGGATGWRRVPIDGAASRVAVSGRTLLGASESWLVVGDSATGRVFVLSHPDAPPPPPPSAAPTAPTAWPVPPLPTPNGAYEDAVLMPQLPTHPPLPMAERPGPSFFFRSSIGAVADGRMSKGAGTACRRTGIGGRIRRTASAEGSVGRHRRKDP